MGKYPLLIAVYVVAMLVWAGAITYHVITRKDAALVVMWIANAVLLLIGIASALLS